MNDNYFGTVIFEYKKYGNDIHFIVPEDFLSEFRNITQKYYGETIDVEFKEI